MQKKAQWRKVKEGSDHTRQKIAEDGTTLEKEKALWGTTGQDEINLKY